MILTYTHKHFHLYAQRQIRTRRQISYASVKHIFSSKIDRQHETTLQSGLSVGLKIYLHCAGKGTSAAYGKRNTSSVWQKACLQCVPEVYLWHALQAPQMQGRRYIIHTSYRHIIHHTYIMHHTYMQDTSYMHARGTPLMRCLECMPEVHHKCMAEDTSHAFGQKIHVYLYI